MALKQDTTTNDPYAGHTPVMRQYLQMRDANPGALLLYRLGDFYECFFDAAVTLNRVLGLTLTRRGTFDGKPIPMAGIPAVTLEQYLVRLVKAGISVAISEQVGNDTSSGMMMRKVVRIITPGTLTDNSLLAEKSDSRLLAIVPGKLKKSPVGLVWITLTNGEFKAAKSSAASLAADLARIGPSEILVEESVRDQLSELGISCAVTVLPDWHFDAEHGTELLKKRFAMDNLEAWGIEKETEILSAASALMGYVEQTQCEALPYIRPLVLENESNFIGIDAASRKNLEITETLRGDAGATLFSVLDCCRTSMGSRLMKHWLHHPLREAASAAARHDAVAEAVAKRFEANGIGEILQSIADIERTSGRIALRSIRPKEAAALRDTIPQLGNLAKKLEGFSSPLLGELAKDLVVDPAIHAHLEAMLLDEPATFLRDGDVIRSSASEELAAVRELRDNSGQFLVDFETRERNATGIASLRVEFNKVTGYYIEIPRSQCNNLPIEYRRKQTLKNVERFITPELKNYEDQALSAKERAANIEKALWDKLLDTAQDWIEPLMRASRAVASIDVLFAFARHAFESRWCKPDLTAPAGLDIRGARHPVVENAIEQYVPNDCRLLPGRRLLVITGPNMGGKSTYMRSVALIALLAYAGSFVPATSCKLGPIDRILTRIGASDDLARGRSTFMVEMSEAASILHQATENSLVLMDEIGRGTSTFDGLSLAGAIAKDLAENTRSWTLFATHYFELTNLAKECAEATNVHVSADESGDRIVFLHDVKDGPASQSYGIAVASLAGVPTRVIRRAKSMMKKLEAGNKGYDPQMDLFAAPGFLAEPEEVRVEAEPDPALLKAKELAGDIAAIDADNLTARQALNLLYEIIDRAKKL